MRSDSHIRVYEFEANIKAKTQSPHEEFGLEQWPFALMEEGVHYVNFR